MKFGLLLAFLLSISIAYSQTDCDCYERLVSLAELRSEEGKSDQALEVYMRALTFLPESARNYRHDFNLSLHYLKNSQIDSAATYLIKSIEGGYPNDNLIYDVRFDSLQRSKLWTEIKRAYRKPGVNFNWKLYNSIRGLYAIDQSIRSGDGLRALTSDSSTSVELFTFVDSMVFDKVMELINLYGYPSQSKHGFHEDYALFFLHSSMYSEEKFELITDHMYSQHKSCLCHKGSIALVIDRRLVWYHAKKQIAGTWNYPDKFSPIDNLTEVDSVRFEYNLLSLADFSQITGRKLPDGYVRKDYPENYFCEKTLQNN